MDSEGMILQGVRRFPFALRTQKDVLNHEYYNDDVSFAEMTVVPFGSLQTTIPGRAENSVLSLTGLRSPAPVLHQNTVQTPSCTLSLPGPLICPGVSAL